MAKNLANSGAKAESVARFIMANPKGYNKKYIHTFQVRTLTSLGYGTRVTLCNHTHVNPELAGRFWVYSEVFPSGSTKPATITEHGYLGVQEKMLIEAATLTGELNPEGEAIIVFYLVPEKFHKLPETMVDIGKSELWFYMAAQDHYVEYYRGNEVATGVLYQCGAFNYPKFSPEFNTLIQAPKFYVSNAVNSYLSLVYTFFRDPEEAPPAEEAVVRFHAQAPSGKSIQWEQKVKPFTPVLVDFRKKVLESGEMLGEELRFYCLYAICMNATLLPLVFNQNEKTGSLTVEHSLPPIYYAPAIRGEVRKLTLNGLQKSELFGARS